MNEEAAYWTRALLNTIAVAQQLFWEVLLWANKSELDMLAHSYDAALLKDFLFTKVLILQHQQHFC